MITNTIESVFLRLRRPEIDQFADGVDLGLEYVFVMRQHGGGVEPVAVFAGYQIGGSQEDRGPIGPFHSLP